VKYYITGSTRGLGKYLADHFNCECLDRPVDLNTDINTVVNSIEEGSTVILNAYASQLKYVYQLKDKCKLVICGSIAAVNPDPSMMKYSEQKYELEKTVQQLALHSKHPMLYLQLTSSSYRDYDIVARSIQFWVDTPSITFIGYNINE
jgi:short-subunit dehydrogenase